MRSERFRTDGAPSLRVQLSSGEIDLETVDGDETSIELTPLNDGGRQAIEAAVVELEERRRLLLFRDAKVLLKVTCPHGAQVELKTVAADVRARGRYAEVDLKGVSGDMRVDDVEGNARLKTVSGDVRVSSVGGELTVQSVSGDTTAERIGGAAELRSVSGDVRVGDAGGSVTIQTVSGDQGVASVTQGAVQLKSVSGDVTLGIARGSRLWIDAKSVSGDAQSDLDISDSPVDGDEGPLVEVRATALSGDITITRG